jgi:hypothetical protein
MGSVISAPKSLTTADYVTAFITSLIWFVIFLLIIAGVSNLVNSKYAYFLGAFIYLLFLIMNITIPHDKVYDPIYFIYEVLNVVYILVFIYLGLMPNRVNEVMVKFANTITQKSNNTSQSGGKRRYFSARSSR